MRLSKLPVFLYGELATLLFTIKPLWCILVQYLLYSSVFLFNSCNFLKWSTALCMFSPLFFSYPSHLFWVRRVV